MPVKLNIMNKIGVIFLTYRRREQKDLLPHSITLKQLYLLRQLRAKECLYPSEIAEMLFCDRPTATVVIKNMEKQQWIKREKDATNGKQVKVTLTDAGLRKLNTVDESLHASKQDDFNPLACFSDHEKEELDALLSKLWHHLKSN